MSDSGSAIQPYADAWLGFLGQVNGIVDTANADDAGGNWGSDAWIRLIHNLIDAQIRTYALLVQTVLAGPPSLGAPSDIPPPTQVTVDAATYPRTITATGFVRLGLPTSTLPDSCIRVDPVVLPAGVRQFNVGLTDYNYVGVTYTGTITFSSSGTVAGANADPPLTITVGL